MSVHSAIEPADYVFREVSHLGISSAISTTTTADDTLFAFDASFSVDGVEVPTAPGANLLSIEFDVSSDADGTFGLFAVAGLGNTEWSDADQPRPNRRLFANVPDAGGPVRIGEVLVPEPGFIIWCLLGAAAVAARRHVSSRTWNVNNKTVEGNASAPLK